MESLMNTEQLNAFNKLFEPPTYKSETCAPAAQPKLTLDQTLQPVYLLDASSLTSSPTSSSSSLSTSLDDEYIKSIWSRPSLDPSHSKISKEEVDHELNPNALPFVPSFANGLHNPHILYKSFPGSASSGSDYGLSELNLDTDAPLLNVSSSSAPLYPPGLPHPPQNAATAPAALPRSYDPLLLAALKATTDPDERMALLQFIVSRPESWDISSLKELVERLSAAAFEVLGASATVVVVPCEQTMEDGSTPPELPEQIVASVVDGLRQIFLEKHGEAAASSFLWNVREIFLQRFILCFDQSTPESIATYLATHGVAPPPLYVRCAFALTRSIAALYARGGIIGADHVRMCISVLIKSMLSIEHVEALALLVLGAGKQFWKPDQTWGPPVGVDAGVGGVDAGVGGVDAGVGVGDVHSDIDPSLSPEEAPILPANARAHPQMQALLTDHVRAFLDGLQLAVIGNRLTDSASVLAGQRWEEGRMMARVREVHDHVRRWQDELVFEMDSEEGWMDGEADRAVGKKDVC